MIRSKFIKTVCIVSVTIAIGSLAFRTVFGQTQTATSSPTISPTASINEQEIQNLKEKIATKVAELRVQNNKAVSGFVTNVSNTTLTVKDENDIEYQIKVDDTLTKYYQIAGSQAKEIKLSDIKQSTFIIITGVANDKVITANIVYVDEMFLVKTGKITEVDKDNYALKVLSSDKDTYTLNIETTTKQQMINVKTLVPETSGFSKIKEGDTIHFVVKKTGKEKDNTYTAIKILIIPQEYFMK